MQNNYQEKMTLYKPPLPESLVGNSCMSLPSFPKAVIGNPSLLTSFSRAGFTLIELLVAVLIIGILSAVALPEYTTAVDKSRFSTLMALTKTVKDAQEVYYLANGAYSANLEELGAPLPDGWTLSEDKSYASHGNQRLNIVNRLYVYMNASSGAGNSFLMWYDHSGRPGRIDCYAYPGDGDRGKRLCKAFGGVETTDTGSCGGGCTIYRLK